jgi:hypothetical protein
MARIVRVVVPGTPNHITQRGNRRRRTFFNHSDYCAHIDLMAEWCARHAISVWGYCLMPNRRNIAGAVALPIYPAATTNSLVSRRCCASGATDSHALESLRRYEHTGRLLGDEAFVTRMEDAVQRPLH